MTVIDLLKMFIERFSLELLLLFLEIKVLKNIDDCKLFKLFDCPAVHINLKEKEVFIIFIYIFLLCEFILKIKEGKRGRQLLWCLGKKNYQHNRDLFI